MKKKILRKKKKSLQNLDFEFYNKHLPVDADDEDEEEEKEENSANKEEENSSNKFPAKEEETEDVEPLREAKKKEVSVERISTQEKKTEVENRSSGDIDENLKGFFLFFDLNQNLFFFFRVLFRIFFFLAHRTTSFASYKRATTAGPSSYTGSSSKASGLKFVPEGFGARAKFEVQPAATGRERRHTISGPIQKYSYERLKEKPNGVDPLRLEVCMQKKIVSFEKFAFFDSIFYFFSVFKLGN